MSELPASETITETRNSLHRVAEHVLSGARKRATGHISLVAGPGGFRTPPFEDGRVIAVDGTELAVLSGADERRAPLTTVRAAAEVAGVEPGFPWTKHPPATPLEPDAPLTIDPDAARVLADWFALGNEALRRFAMDYPEDEPSAAAIYPEHFDLAISTVGCSYGASPGDEHIPYPYVYVGPHDGPPDDDVFWNAPFGAYRTIRQVRSADEALAFFRDGRDRVKSTRQPTRSTP
jgi:hypothetical protein